MHMLKRRVPSKRPCTISSSIDVSAQCSPPPPPSCPFRCVNVCMGAGGSVRCQACPAPCTGHVLMRRGWGWGRSQVGWALHSRGGKVAGRYSSIHVRECRASRHVLIHLLRAALSGGLLQAGVPTPPHVGFPCSAAPPCGLHPIRAVSYFADVPK